MRLASLGCASALSLHTGRADAQVPTVPGLGSPAGIAVFGTGEVFAPPNVVELEIPLSGSGELFGDAVVKFRDLRRRTIEALEALALDNLTIQQDGLQLAAAAGGSQQFDPFGQPVAVAAKSRLDLNSRLRVTLAGIDALEPEALVELLGRVIDAARDAGAGVGPTAADMQVAMRYGRGASGSIARFVHTGIETVRQQAYEKAVADARARADRLAALGGVQLGPVESINEVQVAGEESLNLAMSVAQFQGLAQGLFPDRPGAPRVASDWLSPIPVRVRLYVRYAIAGESGRSAAR